MPRPRSARPAPASAAAPSQRVAYGHHARVFDVALAPSSATSHAGWLASAGEDDAVRVWAPDAGAAADARTDYRQAAASRAHGEPVLRVAWSDDGTALATAGGDRRARVWRFDGESDALAQAAVLGPATEEGYACEFVDGAATLVTTDGADLVAWDVETGTRRPPAGPPPQPAAGAALPSPANPRWAEAHVFGAAVTASSRLAAAACSDGCVRVWSVGADGGLAPVAARRVFAGVAAAVTWLSDGITLAVAGPSGDVAAFDVRAGAAAPPLWSAALPGPALALAPLPSNALAVATRASTVAVLAGGDGAMGAPLVEARVPAPRALLCVASDGAGAVAASGEGVGDGRDGGGAPARASKWAPVTVF